MIPTTLPAVQLPKARGLTDALRAPAGPAPTAGAIAALRQALQDDLASAVATSPSTGRPAGAMSAATTSPGDGRAAGSGLAGSGPVRVDAYLLRTAFPAAGRPTGGSPFRWSPRTARRSIGVAAVGRCVAGRTRTPAEAVGNAVADLLEDARHGHARPGSLAEWLAVVGEGGRAAVLAEATTWATHLFGAIEWDRLERPPVVGGRDRWWDCPSAPAVGLRGRVDVRVPTAAPGGTVDSPDGGDPRAVSLFTMVGGRPGPTSRIELGLAALVDVLSQPPAAPTPARVVGWWPDCGRALVLAVDLPLLRQTAEAVASAVRAAVATHRRLTEAA